MSSFVALDFETANGNPESICSIGMVKVVDHQITEDFYTLVNPKDYFSKFNINYYNYFLSSLYKNGSSTCHPLFLFNNKPRFLTLKAHLIFFFSQKNPPNN